MHNLHTTDELIRAYQLDVENSVAAIAGTRYRQQAAARKRCEAVAKAIPAAIDAVYTARDQGLSMHGAGAAAAIAALKAAGQL